MMTERDKDWFVMSLRDALEHGVELPTEQDYADMDKFHEEDEMTVADKEGDAANNFSDNLYVVLGEVLYALEKFRPNIQNLAPEDQQEFNSRAEEISIALSHACLYAKRMSEYGFFKL